MNLLVRKHELPPDKNKVASLYQFSMFKALLEFRHHLSWTLKLRWFSEGCLCICLWSPWTSLTGAFFGNSTTLNPYFSSTFNLHSKFSQGKFELHLAAKAMFPFFRFPRHTNFPFASEEKLPNGDEAPFFCTDFIPSKVFELFFPRDLLPLLVFLTNKERLTLLQYVFSEIAQLLNEFEKDRTAGPHEYKKTLATKPNKLGSLNPQQDPPMKVSQWVVRRFRNL